VQPLRASGARRVRRERVGPSRSRRGRQR